MSDLLDFPTIDESALAAKPAAAAITTVKPADVALQDLDLQKIALAHFDAPRAAVAAAKSTLTGVVHDLSTPGKLADAKSLRHRLINIPLAEARKVSATLKSKLTAVSKAVGAELTSIEAGFEAAEKLITPQIEARDAEVAAEKAERDRIEAERVAGHRANMAKLAGYATQAQGRTSDQIMTMINGLAAVPIIPEQWEEFAVGAEIQKAETLESLQALFDRTKTAEDEAAAREAQRIENERVAAELAEQARVMAEKQAELDRKLAAIAAAEKAEADRMAAAEDALVSSILDNARRIEADTIGYIEKALTTFEAFAPSLENDPRDRVRSAIADGRAYLAGRLSAAHTAAAIMRQDAEDEANRLAQESAAEALQRAADATPAEVMAEAFALAITPGPAKAPEFDAALVAELAPLARYPETGDFDDAEAVQHIMTAVSPGLLHPTPEPAPAAPGPVTFAEPEPAASTSLAALLAHIDEVFTGRFSAHPKPDRQWWGTLRRLSDEAREFVAG